MKENSKNEEMLEPVISEKDIYIGKYLSFKVLTVEKQKGYGQREIINHSGTIAAIGITKENKIVLRKVYRKTIENESIEIPSKKIDSDENYLDVIKTELFKDLGYEVKEIKNVCTFNTAINYSTEKVYMYQANIEKIESVGEDVENSIFEIPIEELSTYMNQEEVNDSKTIIAILKVLAQ